MSSGALQTATLLVLVGLACGMRRAADDFVVVRSRKTLGTDRLPAERIPLGIPDDYKPCVALLPDGELLVVAFHRVQLGEGKIREDMILFRSQDDGKTWSEREVLDLIGREPYFSVLKDGTILITTHLLPQDVRNTEGYCHSYLHRSTDGGTTWQTLRIAAEDVPGAPADAWTITSRNVLELADGTLILGVSAPQGLDYLWPCTDGGGSWDRTLACDFEGVEEEKLWWGFMAETVFWQARSGDLLGLWRVDPRLFPALPGTELPAYGSDEVERLVVFRSRDGGRTWTREEELGSYYGEMYPAILRLQDGRPFDRLRVASRAQRFTPSEGEGRLLLTFTVRDLRPPLGVHAVLGRETEDGFEFDFENDRIVLDAKAPVGMPSGGGFGGTVQLADGTLGTALSYRGEDEKTHLEVVRWWLRTRSGARPLAPGASRD